MLSKSEQLILKAYLELPTSKLLQHQFELEEAFLAGHVTRFLKGERFNIEFTAFNDEELSIVSPLISNNIQNEDGKDLLTSFLLKKAVCNIMNKYKR